MKSSLTEGVGDLWARLSGPDDRARVLVDALATARERIQRLPLVDPVTQVANRRGLEVALHEARAGASRADAHLAAVLVDCNDFAALNDRFGHAVGDALLRRVAGRIKDVLRPGDRLGRVEADLFLVLLPDTGYAEAVVFADRIRLAVSGRALLRFPESVSVAVSHGVISVAHDALSIDDVLVRARHELQAARDEERGVTTTDIGERRQQVTLAAKQALADVVAGHGIRVMCQSIVDLDNEGVVGFEMLSRGPLGLFEQPLDFLRLARQFGQLTAVDLQCMKACIGAAVNMGIETTFHVNLFPSTLLEASMTELLDVLRVEGTRSRFCLEISEQQFVHRPEQLFARITELKRAGVPVAIDDVGGVLGTVDSVLMLEPDVMKIDRSLVCGISDSETKRRVLRRLISLAGALGTAVVAEGVETRGDAEQLRDLGVPCAQGFLWSRPVMPDTWMQSGAVA